MGFDACRTSALFRTPDSTRVWSFLSDFDYPWEALDGFRALLSALCEGLGDDDFERRGEGILVSRRATVADSALLTAPCIIEEGAVIRHGAFLRGGVLVGRGAVVGNSCELKNALLFDGVQVPHFNYVGDSVLGYRAHLGAGAITSNVKGDRSAVSVRIGGDVLPTGRVKLGAMLGDGVEVGCNAVLNPGTVVGIGARIYPLSCVRGYIPPHTVCKGERGTVPQRGS